jgi:hypothetical protein
MKDHRDLEHYLGEFKTGRLRFIEMGIAYSEYDMVHSIIRSLPTSGSWPHFQMLVTQNTQDHIDNQANALVPAAPDTLLNCIINCLVVECQRIESSKSTKSGAGSEYCNHAGDPGAIRKHDKNPLGVLCTNCWHRTHDNDHYFAQGGGKAKAVKKVKPELAAAVAAPTPDTSSGSTLYDIYQGDLSCAMIETNLTCAAVDEVVPSASEFSTLVAKNAASLLDSGTSSHLLRDQDVVFESPVRSGYLVPNMVTETLTG